MAVTKTQPVRLYILQLALIEDGTPIPGYLIQTSDNKNILIDTGFPTDDAFLARERPKGRSIVKLTTAVDQLADLGLAPRDIQYLVCTHFDHDHSGRHDDFRWSELIVQRTHYEFARTSTDTRFTLTRPHWDHPDLHYRLIDGDYELVPGVELIETSGHVPGHQAVLVNLPHTGPVLLAIDAAAMEIDFDPATRLKDNGVDMDPVEALQSARKMFKLAQHRGVKLVVFGHDEMAWPALKKAPKFYS